jgi:threonylcarbamoyladenosine tRNA methylthiotransferase MtaB
VTENKQKTVAVTTLGCKVNQFESASFISRFKELGAEVVPFSQPADIYIINSCAVTGKAGAQSRQMIRRALRTNPAARVIATGCYTQIAPQEVQGLAEQPIHIIGNDNKDRLVEIALADTPPDSLLVGDIAHTREICELPVQRFNGRTRAYLKVQDGCNNFCTYCIVPYTRGRVRSLPMAQVLEQVKVFAEEGYRELVLTGIHVGMYGSDLTDSSSLLTLVQRLNEAPYALRYRISSLEPGELNSSLLNYLAQADKFMPHFHLPLQSGDAHILKQMNRRYTVEEFTQVVNNIITVMPQAAIGLDTVIGFPGETDEMFQHTYDLIESLPISYLHVFPYSRRPGTPAAKMANQVPEQIKKERAARLRELDHKKRTSFYNRQIGVTHRVLAENKNNSFKMMKGFSENYVPIYFQAPPAAGNTIINVKVERTMDKNVFGHSEP